MFLINDCNHFYHIRVIPTQRYWYSLSDEMMYKDMIMKI